MITKEIGKYTYRMKANTIPKQALEYKPLGLRKFGRPEKLGKPPATRGFRYRKLGLILRKVLTFSRQ
jgi:hypothetical protein